MIELISLAISVFVLMYVFKAREDKHMRVNNDRPYNGPVHHGTRVLHPYAHIVERGTYRALIDLSGHRLWIPYCGYSLYREGIKIDPLVYRHVKRGE